MRKIGVILLTAFSVWLGGGIIPSNMMPQAYAASSYWNGDRNYPLLQHLQRNWKDFYTYLDSSSVVVKKDESHDHHIDIIWAQNHLYVSDNQVKEVTTYWFRDYNGTMYVSSNGQNWRQFDPFDTSDAYGAVAAGCREGWRVAFGVVFS